jgi:hypothetical protein
MQAVEAADRVPASLVCCLPEHSAVTAYMTCHSHCHPSTPTLPKYHSQATCTCKCTSCISVTSRTTVHWCLFTIVAPLAYMHHTVYMRIHAIHHARRHLHMPYTVSNQTTLPSCPEPYIHDHTDSNPTTRFIMPGGTCRCPTQSAIKQRCHHARSHIYMTTQTTIRQRDSSCPEAPADALHSRQSNNAVIMPGAIYT